MLYLEIIILVDFSKLNALILSSLMCIKLVSCDASILEIHTQTKDLK